MPRRTLSDGDCFARGIFWLVAAHACKLRVPAGAAVQLAMDVARAIPRAIAAIPSQLQCAARDCN